MSEERPYREAPAETPGTSLVFYPAAPLSEGLLRLAAGSSMLLALVVALATFRFVVGGLLVPLLVLGVYAARGERHEIEVNEREVVLRRSLWPFTARALVIPRGDMTRVLVEEYDGEARLVFETAEGQKFPLTEAFHRDRERVHELRGRLDSMIFSERALPG